jgi:adenylate cyclase
MRVRVGVNMGDVIIDGENLYGEGVNVAARLESIARPGGVCVSSKIYEEVKRKLDLLFVDGGVQELKNIPDPVAIYHTGSETEGTAGQAAPAPPRAAPTAKPGERPTVVVLPLKVISGDDEVCSLAEGLHEDIAGGLAKQSAIAVVSGLNTEAEVPREREVATDFRLEGSVRAAGQRLRLAFTLLDAESQSQVWSERYDRQLDDIFELEDEVSEGVVAAVRLRIKAQVFERLRESDNETLAVPELLSKAAGYFVHSYGHNDEAAEILDLAVGRAPDSSMAHAMMGFCRYRMLEFSPLDPPRAETEELLGLATKALSLDPSSYFARLIAALLNQDLHGDFQAALAHAETALELNSGFSQAQAMAGIANCHLGQMDRGLDMLHRAIAAAPEDPHRFRHQRELALIHFMAGEHERAAEVAGRLVHQAPELKRNRLVLIALQWHAGQAEAARDSAAALRDAAPEVTRGTARATRFADPAMAEQFVAGLVGAGLPE